MTNTLLVVDDKRELVAMVSDYLTAEGFRVLTAQDGQEALFIARDERPDLILLDLMMPTMGGYDFIRAYTRESDTPIIVLTARLDESDKVLGLELGADDYVTKPFSLRELTARVRALLRRTSKGAIVPDVLSAGKVILDRGRRTVRIEDRDIEDLTPSEFGLLEALMSVPGRVYSRYDLLERLQGDAYEGYERTIDVHIRNLRAKIEPDPRHPQYIETVYGVGYRFAGSLP
ncbi:MAG: response regulator transcription factor [Anaerolineae bacterium]|nr:response regulator transcription factor [Anaerolineae bacterium]